MANYINLFNYCINISHNSTLIYLNLFSVVTIFFAVQLKKAELPDWMDWIVVGFVAFYVLIHLVLSVSEINFYFF